MKRLLLMMGVLGSIVAVTAACDEVLVVVEPVGGGGGTSSVVSSATATTLSTTVTQSGTTTDMTTDVATTTGCGPQMPMGSLEMCAGSQAATTGGGVSCQTCVKDDTQREWVSICSTDEGCECFLDGVLLCTCAITDPCNEPTCCPAPWDAFGG